MTFGKMDVIGGFRSDNFFFGEGVIMDSGHSDQSQRKTQNVAQMAQHLKSNPRWTL